MAVAMWMLTSRLIVDTFQDFWYLLAWRLKQMVTNIPYTIFLCMRLFVPPTEGTCH